MLMPFLPTAKSSSVIAFIPLYSLVREQARKVLLSQRGEGLEKVKFSPA
mgnify:CR=1 FL=1|jgi:hypothetical protein